MSLFRDVFPVMINYHGHDRDLLLEEAEEQLLRTGVVQKGDLIVLTFGEPIGSPGGTNTMKILKVGENRRP
jgi:pyruvate kinase